MWVILWIVFSVLTGIYASSKRRSGLGWFFLSLIISPLIAFIIVAVSGLPQGALKKCPKCAEEVKVEALVCRFCGADVSQVGPKSNHYPGHLKGCKCKKCEEIRKMTDEPLNERHARLTNLASTYNKKNFEKISEL